jgi:uncharacterized membrane protein YccC
VISKHIKGLTLQHSQTDRNALTGSSPCVLVLFMSSQADPAEDHALLGELADLAMDLARDAARRAKEAEDSAEAAELMLAFERMARGVRLTLSLRHRFAREARGLQVEARDQRRKDIRATLRPALRAQARHPGERIELEQDLDERLDREALDEAFAHLPLTVAVERLRKAMGLPPEAPANDPERTVRLPRSATAPPQPDRGVAEGGVAPLQRFGPS